MGKSKGVGGTTQPPPHHKETLSALKALTVLFYSGVDGASFAGLLLSCQVFPSKSLSLISIAFSCTGTALLGWDYFFCEGFSSLLCAPLSFPVCLTHYVRRGCSPSET